MQGRLIGVSVVLLIVALAVIARLFYWQVVMAETLGARATGQYSFTQELLTTRGKILSSDNYPLVANEAAYDLYAVVPKLSVSPESLARTLSPLLTEHENNFASEGARLSPKTIEERTKKRIQVPGVVWAKLADKIPQSIRDKIDRLSVSGLAWQQNQRRIYPEASMAAHVLGILGVGDDGQDKGYFGLEGKYNGELTGRKGKMIQEQDAAGNPILLGGYDLRPSEQGRSLKTTIDRVMQLAVEKRLSEAVLKYGAKGGTVVVMEPKTGAILAIASHPSYSPQYWRQFDTRYIRNPATADTYEPGSTFKALVMAAALEEGLVQPKAACPKCEGPVSIGGFTIRTWNNKYYPNTSMADVLAHSDNIGMVFVGQQLGFERFWRYYDLFGFTKPSGIDVEDEEPPQVRPKKEWKEIDLVTASFGQGIAVNAVQMVRAFAVLANGGMLPEPHLVQQIIGEDKTIEIPYGSATRVIRSENSRVITEMLVNAVDSGEAKWAKPKGYRIAGKTGTAQVPIAGHYDPKKTIASFVGYAPADDPKFVMLVRLTEPTSSPWGSETAAPLFFDIAKDFFGYLGIPPGQ